MKNSKKAVTPVIATIILIAATIVLALVVGAYTFGLFGSNVKTVTLSSATLYAGAYYTSQTTPNGVAYITFSLNNPGSLTTIQSMTLTGSGISSVSTFADYNIGTFTAVNFAATGQFNQMSAGQVSQFAYYLQSSQSTPISTGQIYNYVINFQNGQSVSGSLYAQ